MRLGINVKFSHDAAELTALLLGCREFRHVPSDGLAEYLKSFGKTLYDYSLWVPRAVETYYRPHDAIHWLASEYGFSCVVCSEVFDPVIKLDGWAYTKRWKRGHFGPRVITYCFASDGLARDWPYQFLSPPLCNVCRTRFFSFLRIREFNSEEPQFSWEFLHSITNQWLASRLSQASRNRQRVDARAEKRPA